MYSKKFVFVLCLSLSVGVFLETKIGKVDKTDCVYSGFIMYQAIKDSVRNQKNRRLYGDDTSKYKQRDSSDFNMNLRTNDNCKPKRYKRYGGYKGCNSK